MKFAIPEISWHNRDPVLSVDFQPKTEVKEPVRLATGGTDSHVLIWHITRSETGIVNVDVAADLTRHQKAVNVVRWAPNGQYLASGDDESIIFVWKQKLDEKDGSTAEQGEEQYKESWVIHKTLRGHMEDILDLSWSFDSLHLASGSVDNKLLIWDIARGKYTSMLHDHKGFVQGVSWDPKGQLIASTSTDRIFRTFDINTKKVVSRSSKAILPFPADHPLHKVTVRLYHDDTLQTFYRRLQFSPDGLLIAVPAGRIEPEQGKLDTKPINAMFIYSRYSLKIPICIIPCGESALVVRWSPLYYKLRPDGPKPSFPMQYRMVFAIATKRSVMVYDTQQGSPIALISNIHYTRMTDLTWSPDGQILIASSTDGFCSVITFEDEKLGEVITPDAIKKTTEIVQNQQEVQLDTNKEKIEDSKNTKIDSYIKFKTPVEKSFKSTKADSDPPKTPVKMDVLEQTAMQSWSDNSNNEIIKVDKNKETEVMVIEDSEDIKLVYEETEGNKSVDSQSPQKRKETASETPMSSQGLEFFKQAKVTDIKEPVVVQNTASPKAPRRVSFVTLSSPKNSKKKNC